MDNMDALKIRVLHGYIWSRPTNFIKCHCTFFDHKHYVSKVSARLDRGEIRYAQDKDFIDNSALNLTLDTQMFTQTGTLISHVNLLSSSVIVHTKDFNLSNRNTHLYTCIHIKHLCQRCNLIHMLHKCPIILQVQHHCYQIGSQKIIKR